MKQFIVKVQHDKGIIKIQTAADDAQAAHKIICAAEGCPDCAILSVTELPQAPERQQLDMFIDTGRVDDLPLFSGTPQRVDASHFDPPTVSKTKQTKLF